MTSEIIPGAEPFHLKGSGPKVFLIHGFTATPTEMRPLGDFLNERGYDVYSVLLAGHGTSPKDLQTKTVKDWYRSVAESFDAIDNCDFVVGFSMGGLLASMIAAENNDSLKGLVLLSTFMAVRPKSLSFLVPFLPVLSLFKPYLAKSPDSEAFFAQNNLISYMSYPMRATYHSFKMIRLVKRNYLPRISLPTLVVQGEKDDRIDPDGYKEILELLNSKEVSVELLPNSKHIITVGPDKEQLFSAVGSFLDKHR